MCPEYKKISYGLLTLVFAYYHLLLIENIDLATFRVFNQWNARAGHIRDEVQSYIREQIVPFQNELTENDENDYTVDVLASLIDKNIPYWDKSEMYTFNVQITVFHQYSGTFLASYPETFDETRLQLFFLGSQENNQLKLVSFITNMTTSFNIYGWYCFFLQKSF